MTPFPARAFALASLALLAAPGLADPLLLTPADYPPAQLLPAPPADGSAAQKREMEEINDAQKHMTAEDYAAAERDDKTENVNAFAGVFGPAFDLKALPKTAALFATVRVEEKAAAKLAKNTFLRHRPWVLDPSLKTCTREDAPNSSFPSGHSTMGYSMAVILAALVPEKAAETMTRAQEFGRHRVVCAVHYPTDVVAGEVLGTTVAEELLAKPAFRAQFDAAKTELRAALGLK